MQAVGKNTQIETAKPESFRKSIYEQQNQHTKANVDPPLPLMATQNLRSRNRRSPLLHTTHTTTTQIEHREHL